MSIYFDRAGATSAFETGWSPGRAAGGGESFEAAFNATRWTDVPQRLQDRLEEVYAPIIDQINGGRPAIQGVWNPYTPLAQPGEEVQRPSLRRSAELEESLWARIAAARAVDPQAFPAAPADRDALWAPVIAEAEAAVARDAELSPRMRGAASVAGLAGQLAAIVTDPGVAISLAFGAGAGTSILRGALVEAGVGAGAEAMALPERAALRAALGGELSTEEAILSVVGAGVGAGVGSAVLRGGARAIGLGGTALLRAFDRAVPEPSFSQRAARAGVEAETIVTEASPLGRAPAAAREHTERVIEAMRAVADGTAPRMPDRPAGPLVGAATPPAPIVAGPDGLALSPRALDPRQIRVDASTFQFKAGGDAEGVLDTLVGVRAWDPIRAGMILAWERADGVLFAADGHQRTGLARRLLEANPDADIVLQAYVLREADGVPAEMARAVAAARNIAEGSGSVVDAAKALRVSPQLLGNLPPRSALLRTARDLLPLSDDAFGLIVNDVVDPRWAAIVGRLIPLDDDGTHTLQDAAMAVLARLDPENANQAEAIVRQVIEAGVTRETQLTLFGAETLARSLFAERASVLDGTIRTLKRDRSLFNTLVAGRETAEQAGNVLDTAGNARRSLQDAQAIDTLQRLAQRRGPLSDALSAAARAYAEGGRLDRSVAGFRDAVRDAVARGDFAGDDIELGGARLADVGEDGGLRPGGSAPPEAERLERAQEELFATPAGDGQDAQVRTLERELRARLEAEAPEAPAPDVPRAAAQLPAGARVVRIDGQMFDGWQHAAAIDKALAAGKSEADLDARMELGIIGSDGRFIDVMDADALAADRAAVEAWGAIDDSEVALESNNPLAVIGEIITEYARNSLAEAAARQRTTPAAARSEGREVPIGEVADDGSEISARTMSEREILEEIEADREFAEQLELCVA